MPKQRFGLGRGLDALIPGATAVPDDAPMDTGLSNSALFEVPTAMISRNPQQPRQDSGDAQLSGLVKSIEEFGLLQPLLVRLDDEDEQGAHYQLIAGERRLRAAKIAGLATVPVVIQEATPRLMLEMALVENLQRTDLNPLEEARGYQMLIDDYHLTQEQVAERVGRDRTTVTNTLRLLQLPDEVREALVTLPKVFTEGHARAVLQVAGETERVELTRRIIAQLMSVRQAEEEARRYNDLSLRRMTSDKHGSRQRQQSYDTIQLEREFMHAIEMQVKLQRSTRGKGKLTITFTNDDQLQRLYELLVGSSGDGSLEALTGNGSGHAYAALLGNVFVEEDSGNDN
jgi:ParB family transcriptional regulator, chromosome partitioning protein